MEGYIQFAKIFFGASIIFSFLYVASTKIIIVRWILWFTAVSFACGSIVSSGLAKMNAPSTMFFSKEIYDVVDKLNSITRIFFYGDLFVIICLFAVAIRISTREFEEKNKTRRQILTTQS